jgi:hypothetical protein
LLVKKLTSLYIENAVDSVTFIRVAFFKKGRSQIKQRKKREESNKAKKKREESNKAKKKREESNKAKKKKGGVK